MNDLAGHKPWATQHRGRLLDLSLGERHADGAGRDRPFVDVDMRLDIDFDAEPRRQFDQKGGRADATLAEMEVVADRNSAYSEPVDQIVVNKFLCRCLGAPLVKGHHYGARQSRARQQSELCRLISETKLRGVRAEITPRMRFKGDGESGPPMRKTHAQRRVDHRAMTKMNAVEIAHRHHHSLGDGTFGTAVADHREIGSHLEFLS